MFLKLATAILAILLVAVSLYILMRRQPNNRFKAVDGYSGLVAFDTATGQVCKTLRTRSASEIEQSEADAAQKPVPCPPLPIPSGDPVIDELDRAFISKR